MNPDKLKNIVKFYQEPGFVYPESRNMQLAKRFLQFGSQEFYDEVGSGITGDEPNVVDILREEGISVPNVTKPAYNKGGLATPKRGLVDAPGSYSQPHARKKGEFKPLTMSDQKIYNLFKENKLTWTDKRLRERFVGKEWSKLSPEDRRAFRLSLPTVKNVISKTKDRIGKDELLKITSDAFGEKINIDRLLGTGGGAETRGKLYKTPLGKQVKKLLKPKKIGGSQGSPVFYKRPTKEDLQIMKTAFKDARKLSNFLHSNTIKNVIALDKEFKSIFSKGQIPDIEDVIQRVDGINSPKAASTATVRLAQLYGGSNFNFTETIDPKLKNKFNNIRANKIVSNKMFKKLGEYDWMNPYRAAYYKISLDTIDDALGREVGTFSKFKDQAVAILKANKIPTKGKGAFNINELAGVSGSAKSKAPEFSQFINIIDEKINQKTLRNYDSKLSILRQQIERNPKSKDLQKKIKKFNKFAINLEQEYDIDLAKIRPTKDVTKLFGKKRLAELKAQGIDIEKASKRAGYTIEIPKGTITIEEFASLKDNKESLKTLLEQLCPNKASGGRVGMKVAGSVGVACGANRFKQVFKNPNKGTQTERQLVAKVLKTSSSTAGRRVLNALGPAGIGMDALIEGAVWGDEVLTGASGKQAYNNLWISYLDPKAYTGGLKVSGDRYNETEMAKKYGGDTAKFYRLSHAIEDKYRLQNKLGINNETDAEQIGITLTPNQRNRLKEVNKIIENAGGEEKVYSLLKEDSPLFNAAQISSERFEEVGSGKDLDRRFLARGPLAQRTRDERRKKEMEAYPTYDMFITPSEYKAMDLEQQQEAKNVIPELNLTERADIKNRLNIPTSDNLSEYVYPGSGISVLDEENLRKKWENLINTKGMRGTQDTRYSSGGIADVRRPSAIAPESGPTPQGEGLSYLFNRVTDL